MPRSRVFIYGSCVARDTFEYLDPEQFELIHYVARQSMLSAYSRAVTLIEPPVLESSFQNRQLKGDFSSSLHRDVTAYADKTDLVLIDLTDERLGVYILPDGTVITRTHELVASGFEQRLPQGTAHVKFGSSTHFQYWREAATSVARIFRSEMPRAAIALLDIAWAEFNSTGARTPSSFGLATGHMNAILRPYVEFAAKQLDARVFRLGPADVTSDADHPWGDAPFHYSPHVYAAVIEQLTGERNAVRRAHHVGSARRAHEPGPASAVAITSPSSQPSQPEPLEPDEPLVGFSNLDELGGLVDQCFESLGIQSVPVGPGILAVTESARDAESIQRLADSLPAGARVLAFTRDLVRASVPGVRVQGVPAKTEREYLLKIAGHLEKAMRSMRVEPEMSPRTFPTIHDNWPGLESYTPRTGEPHTTRVVRDGVPFEFYGNLDRSFGQLVVFGQSALVRSQTESLPRFLRWSWVHDIPASAIVLNDPTLYLDDTLDAGWWIGTRDRDYVREMVEIIRKTMEGLDLLPENVLFFGASAGGFSSLQMAACLPGSRALVDIPQTDLREYHLPHHPNAAVRAGLGFSSMKDVRSELVHRLDVIERFRYESCVPRFTYIQNLRDTSHVDSQMLSFIRRLAELPAGFRPEAEFRAYSRRQLMRGGHVPLDRAGTIVAVRELLSNMPVAETSGR